MTRESDQEILDAISNTVRRVERLSELLVHVINRAPTAMTLVDENGGLVCMNRKGQSYMGPGFDLGSSVDSWDAMYLRDDGSVYPVLELPLARALTEQVAVEDEVVVIALPRDRLLRVIVSAYPVRDGEGGLLGAYAIWYEAP